ncbi:hypothetical protein LTR91_008247 [Friedmanniomyces endolithicus]|uniref:Uncharacterized protein n=1 Tax=Friedmanniomyces endolithicus TaxID=329885 RepID=A0AAN6KNP5_9PEZI|nr:hypothetical protein LTR94_014715 [Friedmanniomyces endolithicus]KAK0776442.1 hypothetical protein LTR38_015509 [Friedmanniomyces endolithicus]KAK0794337.1 hypothetical protein LTR75_010852 [Friedmanniomyces endolithicus]KAK0795388.1 hypothetical protein LTR59_007499 [Friedmanniomyces endolithicus]KAK0847887.1 hypothetical protein LTR03_006013 [Friedmanniomyces endolithicus]
MAPRVLAQAFASLLVATALPSLITAELHPRDQSTTVVAVTATSTITQTATNTDGVQGACNNFYGACVVYGGSGDAAYTTTIYATGPSPTHTTSTPTSLVTSTSTATTEVVVQTTTVSNSGACQGYDGSCVVYNTANGAATTTVYAGNNGNSGGGNGNGEIGNTGNGGGNGAIGSGTSSSNRAFTLSFAALALLASTWILAWA